VQLSWAWTGIVVSDYASLAASLPLQASAIVGGDLNERSSASPDHHALGYDKEK
jgi:hypothetical protein